MFNGVSFENIFSSEKRSKPEELPVVVSSRGSIHEEFGRRLAQYFDLNLDTGPWLAGGAVRKSYLGQTVDRADWDIWFRSAVQYDRAEKLMHGLGAGVAFASPNALTFQYTYENQKHNIQLIKRRFFNSAQDIIDQFDFTVCQLVTDGDRMLLGPNTAWDLENRILRSAQPSLQPYIIGRMVKYIVYGYQPCQELIEMIDRAHTQIDWDKITHDYDAS